MDSLEVPEWLIIALTILSSFGGAAWIQAVVPAKYIKYIKLIGPLAEALLKFLGGNWGNAESKPPEQIEAEKQAKKGDDKARKTINGKIKRWLKAKG